METIMLLGHRLETDDHELVRIVAVGTTTEFLKEKYPALLRAIHEAEIQLDKKKLKTEHLVYAKDKAELVVYPLRGEHPIDPLVVAVK
jgi:hypothetical protein